MAHTLGLIAAAALAYGLYRLAVHGAARLAGAHSPARPAGAFAHSLVPVSGRSLSGALAILDALRDDRLHEPRPVVAVRSQQGMSFRSVMAPHLLTPLIFLATLVIAIGALVVIDLREETRRPLPTD